MAEVKAKVESEDRCDMMRCARCGQGFLAKGWYKRHTAQWCESKESRVTALQRERRVGQLLAQTDELRLAAHSQRTSQLRVVEVEVRALSPTEESVGIHLEERKGTFFVSSVDVGSAGEYVCVCVCVCGGGGGGLECERIHHPTSPTFTHLHPPSQRRASAPDGAGDGGLRCVARRWCGTDEHSGSQWYRHQRNAIAGSSCSPAPRNSLPRECAEGDPQIDSVQDAARAGGVAGGECHRS